MSAPADAFPVPAFLAAPPPRDGAGAEDLIRRSKRGSFLPALIGLALAMLAMVGIVLSMARHGKAVDVVGLGVVFGMVCFTGGLVWVATLPRRKVMESLVRAGTVAQGRITHSRMGSVYTPARIVVDFPGHQAVVDLPAVRGNFAPGVPVLVLVSPRLPGKAVVIARVGSEQIQAFAGRSLVATKG